MEQTENASEKKIFLSYAHDDREVAEKLARALIVEGENVWWDQWEILAGDSLVDKIFEEGLADASAIVILLSPNSVRSRWVRQELDVATVRRIEGVTRVIPILIDDVEVPSALRALRRVDLKSDFSRGVSEIVNAVHGISKKPIAVRESIGATLPSSIAGLSPAATSVALFILESSDIDSGQEVALTGATLHDALGLEPQIISDAADEMEEGGLVRVRRALGTAPYSFSQIEPTYVLYQELAEHLDHNPEKDIQVVAATVASFEQISAADLAQQSGLSPGRLNRAVAYLDEYDLVDASRTLGTFPYKFSSLRANRRTRQLAATS